MTKANDAINLEGPNNFRDLGGYPTLEGKRTRRGQFLRGDNPAPLTPRDCEELYQYGVRLQIDLRSGPECQRHPSPLLGYRDVEYHNLPLLDGLNSNMGENSFSGQEMPKTMAPVYQALLDHAKASIAEAFRFMLRFPEDCVLFNCTAGKDRTGVMAMLLLKAARCPDEVIVADFAASYANIRRDVEKLLALYEKQGLAFDKALFRSEPEWMEETLRYFDKTYGDIENWMGLAGLAAGEITALQKKLAG